MKGILIDPEKQEITAVDYSGNYKHIYDLIGCQTFELIYVENGNCLFVDEEGLLNNPKYFFVYKGYHQPLANKGVILGPEINEKTTDCTLTIEQVKSRVSFTQLSVQGFDKSEGKTIKYGMEMDFIRFDPVFGPPKEDEE
jgi:hypothetical protein